MLETHLAPADYKIPKHREMFFKSLFLSSLRNVFFTRKQLELVVLVTDNQHHSKQFL